MPKKLPNKDAEGNWRCPECGAYLVKRKGKFGEFWACSMFRDTGCTYTWDGKFPEMKKVITFEPIVNELRSVWEGLEVIENQIKGLKRQVQNLGERLKNGKT